MTNGFTNKISVIKRRGNAANQFCTEYRGLWGEIVSECAIAVWNGAVEDSDRIFLGTPPYERVRVIDNRELWGCLMPFLGPGQIAIEFQNRPYFSDWSDTVSCFMQLLKDYSPSVAAMPHVPLVLLYLP